MSASLDYKLALDLYDSKSDKLKNDFTHSLAIKACINIGDESKLQELLDSFKDNINFITNIRDETVKYNQYVIAHTMDCLVSSGKLKQGKDLLKICSTICKVTLTSDISCKFT